MKDRIDTLNQYESRRSMGTRRAVALALIVALGAGLGVVIPSGKTCAQKPSSQTRIAVVKSLDLPQYNSAYQGFMKALRSTGYDPVPTIITLPSEGDSDELISELVGTQPDLILALGTRAAREVSHLEKSIPIIYSMVLKAPGGDDQLTQLPEQPNVTGASLNIPLQVHLDHIQALYPTAHRVGIISDPSRTKDIVESARAIAADQGIELHVQWVTGESDIPDAVRAMTDSIDVLWMIPDQTVITPRSSRFIIFELIKAGVPIMGLSSAYVKAGAVIALDCDYEDIGRQSGELAVRILAGQLPSTLAETHPRMFTLALNGKVGEHLRLDVNKEAIEKMRVVEF
jgi:putative ABC transport system substrate-binding protein